MDLYGSIYPLLIAAKCISNYICDSIWFYNSYMAITKPFTTLPS